MPMPMISLLWKSCGLYQRKKPNSVGRFKQLEQHPLTSPFNGLFERLFVFPYRGCLLRGGIATQLALASPGHKLAHQKTLSNGRKHMLNVGYTLSPRSHLSHNWITNVLTLAPIRCESSLNNNEVVTSAYGHKT